jgi:hypothetical protein
VKKVELALEELEVDFNPFTTELDRFLDGKESIFGGISGRAAVSDTEHSPRSIPPSATA